jgi:hypothetical protein
LAKAEERKERKEKGIGLTFVAPYRSGLASEAHSTVSHFPRFTLAVTACTAEMASVYYIRTLGGY